MVLLKDNPHLERRICKVDKKVFYVTRKGFRRRHRQANPKIRQTNSVTCCTKCSKIYLYGERVYNDMKKRRCSLLWK